MKPSTKPWLWAGGLIVIGLLFALPWLHGASDGPDTAESRSEATATATTIAAPYSDAASVPAASGGEAFPWEQTVHPAAPTQSGTPPTIIQPGVLDHNVDPRSLVAMQQQVRESQQAADTLLKKLDEWQSDGKQPEGVNVDALRTNVLVAKRAQVLALEMMTLGKQPSSPERDGRVQTIVAELQQLRGQLRNDVSTPPSAPAAR